MIETVQTLATKYGQEHKENIVGTISASEAREMLMKNKGSVWHAVTQCVEKRQQAFSTIQAQGNYSREDIVTSLTAHNGNVELALTELTRSQMKPFLLKIQSSPPGTVYTSTNELEQPSTSTQQSNNQSNPTESEEAKLTSNDNEKTNDDKNDILRDIEAIIGSMEEKQSKQTENLLNTIENLVGNMMQSQNSRSISGASSFNGLDRIDVKSPILIPTKIANTFDESNDVETEVKHFVSRHIQDVVPDVAALISKELIETPTQNDDDEQSQSQIEAIVDANGQIENVIDVNGENSEIAINLENTVIEQKQPQLAEQNEKTQQTVEVIETTSEVNVVPSTSNEVQNHVSESHIENNQPETPPKITIVVEPIQNEADDFANTLVEPSQSDRVMSQQPRVYKPRYVVTKSSARFSQKQIEKRRIRELEKMLKRQQKALRRDYMKTDRSDSRNTGYMSDSTVVADDNQDVDKSTVSNEKTFSLSIVEQAVHVDDNKEHNQTLPRLSPQKLSVVNQPTTSNGTQPEEVLSNGDSFDVNIQSEIKDMKNRNLSDMVEHTKSLIQQMKNEIDEDIAMSASEFGDGDGYLSDEMLYSEEEIGEFSDSWEDISDEESIISGEDLNDNFYYDQRNGFEFLRSSQSVESEFYVEARESLTSENEQIDEDFDENVIVLDNIEENGETEEIDVKDEVDLTNHAENIAKSENNSNDVNSSSLPPDSTTNNSSDPAVESISEHQNSSTILNESQQNTDVNSSNAPAVVISSDEFSTANTKDDVIIEQNNVENQNGHEIESQSMNESIQTADTANAITSPIPPTDETLMEHMLEIQQSLHTSSIISVNFRETQLRENSQSVEPGVDTPISSDAQSPDPNFEVDELIAGRSQVTGSDQMNDQNGNVGENEDNLATESLSIDVAKSTSSSSIHDEHVTNENGISNGNEESKENEEIKEDEEASVSISDNQQSVSTSEKVSQVNDSESELDELSVDASVSTTASESSASKDISVHSTLSNVSTAASEKLVESYQYQKMTIPVITQCISTSINVMQLKKTTPIEKIPVKNKIPVRRPSITEPSASIRNIQNELFNKQLRPPPKVVSKKPSKIVPPKLFFKSNSATEPSTSAESTGKSSKVDHNKPSTSGEKPSIPKKKYYETCFSDDNYQTSDDEKPNTNMKVIPNLVNIIESNTEENIDREVSNFFIKSELGKFN